MNRALVLQAARFGDLVQSKRLLLSVGRRFQILLCVDKSLCELAKILYPDAEIIGADFHAHDGAMPDNTELFARLAALDFERVYNLNFSSLTAAICRLFEPSKIISYRPAHTSDGGIIQSPWARLAFRISRDRAASPLNLVDMWAYMDDDPVAPHDVNPVARPGGGGMGIALSGRESRRSLPPNVLVEIARIVFGLKKPPRIKLFGTNAESRAARRLIHLFDRQMARSTIDLCGKTDWAQLVEEMQGLDLLITPDTGLMHLAAHLGVPVLAFFLSSALCHETGPYGKGHLIWQSAPDCAPCLEKRACPRNVACLAPFANENFGRLLGLAISGAKMQEMPDGLQLWASGFDPFGAAPGLIAGKDRHAPKRQALRSMLANWQHVGGMPDAMEKLPPQVQADLAGRLFPTGEWMLPGWRYC